MSEFRFYNSFLSLLDEKTCPYPKELDDASFRKFLLQQTGRTPELVKTIAPALQSRILKPQQLLHDDDDYYVATDMVTNTYYVCYRNLLMVDIDFYKDEQTLTREQRTEQLMDKLRSYCEGRNYRFRVFSTQNGVHAFLVSAKMDYRDDNALKIMLDLGTDFYYVVFSYLRGWSVRLNKKKRDTTDELYSYIGDIGAGVVDPHLDKLVTLHLNLVPVFKHVEPCLMYGG